MPHRVKSDAFANGISILLDIIRMENQSSDLDTLSRTLSLSLPIHKRAMRYPPSPPVELRIKTFDQQNLPRRLLPKVKPAMLRVRTNRKGLSNTVRINQLHGQEVLVGHGGSVRHSEGIFADGFDGAPDVDDLVAAFEETLGFGGEVVLDALGAGFVGLVDVHALDGTAEGLGAVGLVLVGRWAADGVVEDEDLGAAGAEVTTLERDFGLYSTVTLSKLQKNEKGNSASETVTLRGFQNVFDFGIINPLDLRLVLECRFLADMRIDLKPRRVQGILILRAANIMHDHRSRLGRSLVCLGFANVGRRRRTAVAGILVVVELGDHITGLATLWDGLAY